MEKYNLNNVRKDLKIVYSDNGSISLVFQNNTEPTFLFTIK